MKILLAAITLLTAVSAVADHHGNTLTNTAGMTLYIFDKDSGGTSTCYDGCAAKWPPYIAVDNATVKEGWGLTERKDGAKQWTYNNQPLYTWVGDTKAGDATGDGVGGVWHTAKKGVVKSEAKTTKSGYSY
jgi:predicted lipoprotein with Yx(FWY)xxD motif